VASVRFRVQQLQLIPHPQPARNVEGLPTTEPFMSFVSFLFLPFRLFGKPARHRSPGRQQQETSTASAPPESRATDCSAEDRLHALAGRGHARGQGPRTDDDPARGPAGRRGPAARWPKDSTKTWQTLG
jgi:hypothetical protein